MKISVNIILSIVQICTNLCQEKSCRCNKRWPTRWGNHFKCLCCLTLQVQLLGLIKIFQFSLNFSDKEETSWLSSRSILRPGKFWKHSTSGLWRRLIRSLVECFQNFPGRRIDRLESHDV